eukprot:TRINITY_DN1532_c0_g1_i20.p1 TRINITY_DN1532_c0_g1~~TRINITY_DN1532_c0_g1_i20.p1  ORF type:complete len:160 (+),score=22.37 TRINITY_DN1532_c0_g1_i20:231-710(+)
MSVFQFPTESNASYLVVSFCSFQYFFSLPKLFSSRASPKRFFWHVLGESSTVKHHLLPLSPHVINFLLPNLDCRNLRSLALSDCQDFSEGIRCLARSCKRLKKLVFTFSSRLDDKTVNDVLDNCKFLTDLHLHGRGMCFSQATLSRCRRTLVAFQAVTS